MLSRCVPEPGTWTALKQTRRIAPLFSGVAFVPGVYGPFWVAFLLHSPNKHDIQQKLAANEPEGLPGNRKPLVWKCWLRSSLTYERSIQFFQSAVAATPELATFDLKDILTRSLPTRGKSRTFSG